MMMKKMIGLLLMVCVGCAHRTPTISTDTRVVIKSKDIINPRDLSEDEAVRIYDKTGVYRGLTDDEWIFLLQALDDLRALEREQVK